MARRDQRQGVRLVELPDRYFDEHFPPSYYRDPEEQYEALGYEIDERER